jgi:hypothetical protein
MRIAHLADFPAVMHIQRNGESIIALPSDLSNEDILELASLVLSSEEFAELAGQLPGDDASAPA